MNVQFNEIELEMVCTVMMMNRNSVKVNGTPKLGKGQWDTETR